MPTDARVLRTNRAKIRKAIESFANAISSTGYVTQWALVSEITEIDAETGETSHRLFVSNGDYQDNGMSPWAFFGMVDYAMNGLQEGQDEDVSD